MDERSEILEDSYSLDEMGMEPMLDDALVGSTQRTHSLMDVLRPASPPPQPKNARIIRRFDLEAAKDDAKQQGEGAAKVDDAGRSAPANREFSRSREELRALRNRSLAAAAGLV